MGYYGRDLAYIHDAGYLEWAEKATPAVVRWLREAGIRDGQVVELGSGSGETAERLAKAGYEVLGIDASRAMVEMARSRAPSARFRVGSWTDAKLPEDRGAIVALGEVLGYLGSVKGTDAELSDFFRRAHAALRPGGMLIFDLAIPGRVPGGEQLHARSGEDWAITSHASEQRGVMERRLETFRRIAGGATYRRGIETHRLKLRPAPKVAAMLRKAGFRVRTRTHYPGLFVVPGLRVFIARR